MQRSSWSMSRIRFMSMAVVAGLGLLASGVTQARVGLDGNVSKVNADIGTPPSPPYLVSLNINRDPTWVTVWLEDPIALSGGHIVGADAEAWYRDPFDSTEPYDLIPIPFTCAVEGSATYQASAGSLHASASALATLTPSSYTAVAPDSQPPVEIPSPYFGGAFAGIGIYYDDTVTFASASLPVGSPIEIELTVHHDTVVSTSMGMGGGPPYPNHAYSVSRLSLGTYDPSWNNTHLGGDPLSVLRDEIINGTPVIDDPSSAVFNFAVGVGDHFYVKQILEVWARATVDAGNANAGSVADSSNTAGVYLRSLTDGVSIESESGYSYAAPVPEPGSVLLQAAALTTLAVARRRRTSRVRADG